MSHYTDNLCANFEVAPGPHSPLILSLWSTLVLLLLFSATLVNGSEEVSLKIIWNVKTGGRGGCEQKQKVPLDVSKYGILENNGGPEDFDGCKGNAITSLYQTDAM